MSIHLLHRSTSPVPSLCTSCRHVLFRHALRQRANARRASSSSSPPESTLHRKPSQKLPSTPARTRFAPSPTGFLHLGSLRTALFNYLLAKATGGQFLLRIEDTDTRRTVPGALDRICRDLEWAGLQWDEGPEIGGPHGPYLQSQRTAVYAEHARKLVESGHAYRCFCTAQRLAELAEARAKSGLPTDYDRTCASLSREESDDRAHGNESHVVRMRSPSVYPQYTDLVYGHVGKAQRPASQQKFGQEVFEDPILLKSDGNATYHLANVVDDHMMQITHVVRAVEWMPSTSKHLALYAAFGWAPPAFAHVGLLQDTEGRKLSKRNADVDISHYREKGYLPEALTNFLALLGWSHGRGSDVMSSKELVGSFDLKFTKGNTLVTFKKLEFLQNEHVLRYVREEGTVFEDMIERMVKEVEMRQTREEGSAWTTAKAQELQDLCAEILKSDAKRYTNAKDFIEANAQLFRREVRRDSSRRPDLDELADGGTVRALAEKLEQLPEKDWSAEALRAVVDESIWTEAAVQQMGEYVGDYEKQVRKRTNIWLRWALVDRLPGPPVATTMAILGKGAALTRIYEAEEIGRMTTMLAAAEGKRGI